MTELVPPEDLSSARKLDLVWAIASAIGIDPPPMSTGSTEPRLIFAAVNDRLGLGIDPSVGKPDLARGIVEASGSTWQPDYESRGATVTREGIAAVYRAVYFFLH